MNIFIFEQHIQICVPVGTHIKFCGVAANAAEIAAFKAACYKYSFIACRFESGCYNIIYED